MRAWVFILSSCALRWLVACVQAETVVRTQAERQYAFALGLYQQGLYDLAGGEFAKFAEQFPEDPRREAAVFYAAQSLFLSGKEQREAALAALLKYQEEYAGSESQFYSTSFYLLGEIHLQKAEEVVPRRTPGEEQALPEEVRQAYDRALSGYIRCTELSPGKSKVVATALSRAGYCASRLGKWAQAVGAYRNLADQYQSLRAQFMVGEAFCRWGETEPANLSDAIRAYKRVGLFGDNSLEDDAAVGLAWCLYKQGKFQECRRYLEEQVAEGLFSRVDRDFKQRISKLPEAYYLLGLCSSELGDRTSAASSFRLLSKYPECPFRLDGLAKLGELLGGNFDRSTGEGAEISYATGRSLMEAEKPSEAVAEFERLYRSYPKMATAAFRDELLYDWAVCYERLECYREALAIVGYLSRRSSDMSARARAARVEALCHRRLAREASDPVDENSEELEALAALKRYADNTAGREAEKTLGKVGDFFHSREMYARASLVYEELLSRFPRSSRRGDILFRLGRCHAETKDEARAISCFEQCRREYASSLEAVFSTERLAVLFAGRSQYEAALVEYSRLQPDSFPGLSGEAMEACEKVFENAAYARGMLREKMGDIPGALSELDFFILQYPDSQEVGRARLSLARLHFGQGQYEETIGVLRPYFDDLEKYPDLEMALVTVVGSFLKLGRPADAIEHITRILKSRAGAALPPRAFARVSRVMEKEGQRRGARLPFSLLIDRQRKLYNAMTAAAANAREMVEKREYRKTIEYCTAIIAIHAPERVSDWKG
ncbi:MAG: tetratricopeptide repeat protein, partial [Acidobacteriota bacterium]